MNREQLTLIALSVLLALAGAGAWGFALRAPLVPSTGSLDTIPFSLGRWEGTTIPVGGTVESILNATHNVQRAYRHPDGDLVWLYIGYYGTERGGTPDHTPRACYNAHGWEIAETTTVVRESPSGLEANEYIVEFEGERRLVVFWYQSFRSGALLSTAALRIDHVLGQLSAARGDGALVRLSTRIVAGDRAAARSRLLGFSALLEPALDQRWPEESSAALSSFGFEESPAS